MRNLDIEESLRSATEVLDTCLRNHRVAGSHCAGWRDYHGGADILRGRRATSNRVPDGIIGRVLVPNQRREARDRDRSQSVQQSTQGTLPCPAARTPASPAPSGNSSDRCPWSRGVSQKSDRSCGQPHAAHTRCRNPRCPAATESRPDQRQGLAIGLDEIDIDSPRTEGPSIACDDVATISGLLDGVALVTARPCHRFWSRAYRLEH